MKTIHPLHPSTILSTWFWVGLLPLAPGTWGSAVAVVMAWFIKTGFGEQGDGALVLAFIAVFLAGWWAAGHYERRSDGEDPGEIVIDEVAGQWLACLFLPPIWWLYLLAFVAFRVFDIFKPWPVDHLDKHGTGGLGIMQDDVAAGLYVLLLIQVLLLTVGTAWTSMA